MRGLEQVRACFLFGVATVNLKFGASWWFGGVAAACIGGAAGPGRPISIESKRYFNGISGSSPQTLNPKPSTLGNRGRGHSRTLNL